MSTNLKRLLILGAFGLAGIVAVNLIGSRTMYGAMDEQAINLAQFVGVAAVGLGIIGCIVIVRK